MDYPARGSEFRKRAGTVGRLIDVIFNTITIVAWLPTSGSTLNNVFVNYHTRPRTRESLKATVESFEAFVQAHGNECYIVYLSTVPIMLRVLDTHFQLKSSPLLYPGLPRVLGMLSVLCSLCGAFLGYYLHNRLHQAATSYSSMLIWIQNATKLHHSPRWKSPAVLLAAPSTWLWWAIVFCFAHTLSSRSSWLMHYEEPLSTKMLHGPIAFSLALFISCTFFFSAMHTIYVALLVQSLGKLAVRKRTTTQAIQVWRPGLES